MACRDYDHDPLAYEASYKAFEAWLEDNDILTREEVVTHCERCDRPAGWCVCGVSEGEE